MKLNGICLNTKNVLSLAGFYGRILCMEPKGDASHMELKTSGGGIAIFSLDGMEAMAPNSTRGLGAGTITLMFEVEGVDQEYERLKGLGVDMIKPPETYPWGARSFWFKDPDGNIVDFYEQIRKR